MAHRQLIPAVAVVDSRNLAGQCRDLLGSSFAPTVPGIRAALARYGFDVGHVSFATAVEVQFHGQPSERLQKAQQQNAALAAAVAAVPDTTLLKGRLVERGPDMDEKLVDVLCAVEVLKHANAIQSGTTNARAVIVLSQDLDMTPAYPVAESLGVPVYALAHDVVHTRKHRWLLLTQAAAFDIVGRPQYKTGHEVRGMLASFLHNASAAPGPGLQFKKLYTRANTVTLVHRSNVQGEIATSRLPAADSITGKYKLYPAGVTFADADSRFPRLLLSPTPTAIGPEIVSGTVTGWTSPTDIAVDVNGATVRVSTSAGFWMPGCDILLHVGANRASAIGCPTGGPTVDAFHDLTEPVAVRIVSLPAVGTTIAAIDGTSLRALLLPSGSCPSDQNWKPGDRLNAIVTEQRPEHAPAGGPSFVARAISSLLRDSA